MDFRQVGGSGLRVSSIAYGQWLTHGMQVDQDVALACIKAAQDAGITTFDTADMYAGGVAEVVLGKALMGQARSAFEIVTKVYWPTGDGANDRGLSRKHIMESIHGSLRRLGMRYVDVYMAHRFDYFTPLEETMQAFADVVRQGKALYIGVSEWTVDQVRAGHALAVEMGVPLVVSQNQYSALWRVGEGEVFPACAELGMGIMGYSPVAQGVLTGKYPVGGRSPASSRAVDKDGRWSIAALMSHGIRERVLLLEPLADQAGLTMAQLAIAWVLQRPGVATAIIGASRPEQVTENVKAAGVTLDAGLMQAIDEALRPVVIGNAALMDECSPKVRK